MADVYVNNWFEFISAVGVQGNKVILPENSDWDMADVLPYGISGFLILCDEIDGRGTAIKNLLLNRCIEIGYGVTIENLQMLDWMCDNDSSDAESATNAVFFGGPLELKTCVFSGIMSTAIRWFYSNAIKMYNCSVNIETSGTEFKIDENYFDDYGLNYCRIEIKGNNLNAVYPISCKCNFSEIIIYAPNLDESDPYFHGSFYSSVFSGCVLRGNTQGIINDWSSTYDPPTGFVSVYDVDMFADTFTPIRPLSFVGCTDEQLKNPVYLREKGFPIVIPDGGDA